MNSIEQLKAHAENEGASSVIKAAGVNINLEIPLYDDFLTLPIDELNLSVRARNGLMRAGLYDIRKLATALGSDEGIGLVRNLGIKSADEIKCRFLDEGYSRLNDEGKTSFWNKVKEVNRI